MNTCFYPAVGLAFAIACCSPYASAQAQTLSTPPAMTSCATDACRTHANEVATARSRLERANTNLGKYKAVVTQLQNARAPLATAVKDQARACDMWRATKPRNPTKAEDDIGTHCENRSVQAGLTLASMDARLNAAVANLDAARVETAIATQGLGMAETALANCKKICRLTP